MAATADGPQVYAAACASVDPNPRLFTLHGGRMRSGPPSHRRPEPPGTGAGAGAGLGVGAGHEGMGALGHDSKDAGQLTMEHALGTASDDDAAPPSGSQHSAGSAHGTGAGQASGSGNATRGPSSAGLQFSLRPQLAPIDHPWYHIRLTGPICLNIATYHNEQPLLNMKRLSDAVDAAATALGRPTGSSIGLVSGTQGASTPAPAPASATLASPPPSSHTTARMYDWKGHMAGIHRKSGLDGFFARQTAKAAASAGAGASAASVGATETGAGSKRSRAAHEDGHTSEGSGEGEGEGDVQVLDIHGQEAVEEQKQSEGAGRPGVHAAKRARLEGEEQEGQGPALTAGVGHGASTLSPRLITGGTSAQGKITSQGPPRSPARSASSAGSAGAGGAGGGGAKAGTPGKGATAKPSTPRPANQPSLKSFFPARK